MMLTVSSNGSRLHNPGILEMLTTRRPYRLTLSVYGSAEASYDGLTPSAWRVQGVHQGSESYGVSYAVFSNISPTIYSGAETLPSQSEQFLRERKPFTGCGAGHTHFRRPARPSEHLQSRP